MQGLCHELWSCSFPVTTWLVVYVWEVEFAIAVVRHNVGPVFIFEISLAVVPVIVLTGLSIEFVLLLVTKLDRLTVHCWVIILHFHCFLQIDDFCANK